ncbi:Trafficking protein particle complex subunit 6B [Spathaspora sp. JA1]|nr:Trafficking protein particle complex subunit 6B [Spathaspora sp. JA1]
MSEEILDRQTYVNSTTLDLFLQELIPTSIRVSQKLMSTTTYSSEDTPITNIDQPLSTIPGDLPGTVNVLDSMIMHNDEVTIRIEKYGYNLGVKISEALLYKNGGGAKIVDILDIMKFVCRDVWKCLYNKQMDNLRTNHRGTFVLVDTNYKLISSLNSPLGLQDTMTKAKVYMWFPCGIIRGILKNFGIDANVTAEITQFPSVTFNIHTSINN